MPCALIKASSRRASLLAATAYAAGLGIASAEPSQPTPAANLEVDADPACTTRAELITRVRARSPRVRFVDDGNALAIRVQISTSSSGVVAADVTLASGGTPPSVRRVPARSCTEAADAVALIIAVTLDPTSVGTRTNTSTAKEGTTAAASGASSVNDGEPRAEAPATASPNAEPPVANAVRSGASPWGRTSFSAQLSAEVLVGVAPGAMPSIALSAMASFDRPSLWSPAFVLGVRHAWRTEVPENGGRASFKLDAATLDACPLRFRVGAIEARPCGSLLFGGFSAQGTDTLNPAAESVRPFWVIGGAAVVTADLAWHIQLSGRLAVGANLVRDSFEFKPDTFHSVPAASAAASLGVGVRWR